MENNKSTYKKTYKKLCELLVKKYLIDTHLEITSVEMDSRKVVEGTLFFAINSGNSFIYEAIKNGASLVICDDVSKDVYEAHREKIVVVEDTVSEMQHLASQYRQILANKIVAITGSNGKTSTKDILHNMLSQKYLSYKTQGNYNNAIGLPFTILNLDDENEVAVLELGMSSFGEIDLLAKISRPNFAIITNIGVSHLEQLKSRENIFKAKTEILNHVDIDNVVVCGDDDFLKNLKAIKVGYGDTNDFIISDFSMKIIEEIPNINFKLNEKEYSARIMGRHSAVNISLAIVVAKKLGVSQKEIEKALLNLKLTKMRLELSKIGNKFIINDAYNASPSSTYVAMTTLYELKIEDRKLEKILILGDMLELGDEEILFHEQILLKACEYDFDKIYIYGERYKSALKNTYSALASYKSEVLVVQNLTELENDLAGYLSDYQKSAILLFKSSNGMKLGIFADNIINKMRSSHVLSDSTKHEIY